MPDYDPVPSQRGGASKPSKKKKKKGSGLFGRIVRRFFLVLFTVIALILVAACLAANLIFNGPSPAARDILTMTLLEPSGTKWIPGLFMDAQTLDSIRTRDDSNLKDEFSNTSEIVINKDAAISAGTDEWANSPDGIRFESHSGDTYNAHIMIVRDPSKVYLGTSTENFSTSIPGTRSRPTAPLPVSMRARSSTTAPPTPPSAPCRRDWFTPRASASGRPALPPTASRASRALTRTTSLWSLRTI